MLAQLQAENEELRGRAVELALAIQDLRDNRTQRT
jgi:cell division protein FtsB